MSKVELTIALEGSGDPKYPNVAGVTIPPAVVAALGGRGRIPIKGTINGSPFRTTICVMGGRHMFCVNKEMRAGAGGVAPGDVVRLVLENDLEVRTVAVPEDFAAAMDGVKGARATFDALAFTHRKEHVKAIEEAKKPETRRRRIEQAIAMLAERVPKGPANRQGSGKSVRAAAKQKTKKPPQTKRRSAAHA